MRERSGQVDRAHRVLYERGLPLSCDRWWTPVRYLCCPSQPLFLSKARLRNTRCSLITNEAARKKEQPWAGNSSWRTEAAGLSKPASASTRATDPAESVSVSCENSLKLLALVVLVDAFLIFLLTDVPSHSIQVLSCFSRKEAKFLL